MGVGVSTLVLAVKKEETYQENKYNFQMAIKKCLTLATQPPEQTNRDSSPCLGGGIPRPEGNHPRPTRFSLKPQKTFPDGYQKKMPKPYFRNFKNHGSSPCTGGRYPPSRWQRPQKQSGNHQIHTQGKLPLPTFPIDNILRGDAPAPWAVFRSLGGRFMSTLRNALLCWTEMAPVGSPEHAPN